MRPEQIILISQTCECVSLLFSYWKTRKLPFPSIVKASFHQLPWRPYRRRLCMFSNIFLLQKLQQHIHLLIILIIWYNGVLLIKKHTLQCMTYEFRGYKHTPTFLILHGVIQMSFLCCYLVKRAVSVFPRVSGLYDTSSLCFRRQKCLSDHTIYALTKLLIHNESLACYASRVQQRYYVWRMKTSNGIAGVLDMFEKGKVLKICAPMVRYSK